MIIKSDSAGRCEKNSPSATSGGSAPPGVNFDMFSAKAAGGLQKYMQSNAQMRYHKHVALRPVTHSIKQTVIFSSS